MATMTSTVTMEAPQNVLGSFNFMKPNRIHEIEKPYRLQYNPGDDLQRTNIELEERHGIPIRNLRYIPEKTMDFDKCGFAVAPLHSSLSEESFGDEKTVEGVYYPEVQELLHRRFKPKFVKIMEHLVRRRHVSHPISTGGDYEFLQPTSIVHSDFTPVSAIEAVEQVFKLEPTDYSRIVAVNVWKPLHGPVEDWPLALCDAEAVNPSQDLQPADVVMRNGYTENSRVYYNANYKWYYLSGQLDTEALIFRQFDTAAYKPVIHSGFKNPACDKVDRLRESVEVRAFMFFE